MIDISIKQYSCSYLANAQPSDFTKYAFLPNILFGEIFI